MGMSHLYEVTFTNGDFGPFMIAGDNPERLRQLVAAELTEAETFGCGYQIDCLAENIRRVNEDVDAGRFRKPQSVEEFAAAIVKEYRANIAWLSPNFGPTMNETVIGEFVASIPETVQRVLNEFQLAARPTYFVLRKPDRSFAIFGKDKSESGLLIFDDRTKADHFAATIGVGCTVVEIDVGTILDEASDAEGICSVEGTTVKLARFTKNFTQFPVVFGQKKTKGLRKGSLS
jgi:hypothetical protein